MENFVIFLVMFVTVIGPSAVIAAIVVFNGVVGFVQEYRAEQAMDEAERQLVSEADGLIRLLTPPFDRTAHDPGYIKGYVPGVRENGGHAVAMKYSMKAVYDIDPGDVYWAASDVGWVVGHSYIVYGPLFKGCTTILFEGKPVGTPDAGVFWRVISQHGVRSLFTAPTAFRAIKREAEEARKRQYIEKYLPHIGDALRDILGQSDKKRDQTVSTLKEILERARTP